VPLNRFLVYAALFFFWPAIYLSWSSLQGVRSGTVQHSTLLTGELVRSEESATKSEESFAPLLPSKLFAAPGIETSIYFDNLLLARDSDYLMFSIECHCPFARMERRRWVAAPKASDTGTYDLILKISDPSGTLLAQVQSSLIVPSPTIQASRQARVLIVGDSIGHSGQFPDKLNGFDSMSGNPVLQFVGTFRPSGSTLPHEAYSGWTWNRFLTHYAPGSAARFYVDRSPFVFLDPSGEPQLDVARYVRESLHGAGPDIVFFLLGINDAFGFDPDQPTVMDSSIDKIFNNADTLLREFRTALPKVVIGVGIIIPANYSDRAFQELYPSHMTRWRWKRIQYRVAQRMIEHFQGRERKRIFLVPTHLNLDTIDGYSAHPTNAVHPNQLGARQLSASIYGWLKWVVAERGLLGIEGN
jgi:lysophospholipase L1-like esterase